MILWQQLRNFRQVPGGVRCIHTPKKYHSRTALQKKKRIYKSFTSDIPGPKGKRDAEKQAADWAAKKNDILKINNITLGTAIDKYIESKDAVLSITTFLTTKRNERMASNS